MRQLVWNIFYLLGRAPWDTGVTPPEVVELIEGGQVPPGRALDIGCGTGTNAVYLARHGFQAVGVDAAWLVVRRARAKARRAGVSATFHTGDVLRLGTPKGPAIVTPFEFVLDIGCFHSLAAEQRQAYAAMLRRVLRVEGFYMLYAWGPREMNGRPVGLTPDETRAALGDEFRSVWVRGGEERGAASYWYLFQRARQTG